MTTVLFAHVNSLFGAGRLAERIHEALIGADDGDLFVENRATESLIFEDGRIRSSSFGADQGFGLRRVVGSFAGLVHGNQLTPQSLAAAATTLAQVAPGARQVVAATTPVVPALYPPLDPLAGGSFEDKVRFLAEVDAYVRAKDPRVKQVTVALSGQRQEIVVVRPDGVVGTDVRPLVRFDVSVVVEDKGRRESGHHGLGGREDYTRLRDPAVWKAAADDALRMAVTMLDAKPAPAGEMPVVLSAGWSGVLLHEAVGHGLEGDFNRKGTSAFAGLLGNPVAAKGVSVFDDGTLPGRRGSLTIDDEGTPSHRTPLIEDGRLVGYIHDRLNARLLGAAPTGNGRRQSYAHLPMPRMTNTYMTGGDDTPEDIIKATPRGLYAKTFGGGQVDITSGRFVFNVAEAYLIENGRLTHPVKGASLIGSGPEALKFVDRIGNDMALDNGIGTCGKNGQSVPVGVGQPTLRLAGGITIGGTA
jgi:TldD protein